MVANFVRASNNSVLSAAGAALLLLAARSAEMAAARHFPMSLVIVSCARNTILGAALLYVALRASRLAGVTGVIVATVLAFSVVMNAFASLAVGSAHVTWWAAVDLGIAGAILAPSLFPWNWSANKPVLFWTGLTFGTMTLFIGIVALLARL